MKWALWGVYYHERTKFFFLNLNTGKLNLKLVNLELLMAWSCFLWLGKFSASERRCYRCNISHWLRPCSAMGWNQVLIKNTVLFHKMYTIQTRSIPCQINGLLALPAWISRHCIDHMIWAGCWHWGTEYDQVVSATCYARTIEWLFTWINLSSFNSLGPGQNGSAFRNEIFKYVPWLNFSAFIDIAYGHAPNSLTDSKSALVWVMAWCQDHWW